MEPLLGIACPQIVYPYLRANVADAITRASFPPIQLAEINFQAMYEAQRAQDAAAAAASKAPVPGTIQ
jgi:preprotein translocase subunit SecB